MKSNLMNIKTIILKIFVAILNVVYLPIKLFSCRRKVTFISRQSNIATMDIFMLDQYIKSSYPNVKSVVLAKKIERSLVGIFSYGIHILEQMYHIATSRVVVIDGYCIAVSVLRHKKNTYFIQMWHALGAVKKFGYQTIDKFSGHSAELAIAMHMHENYDYVLCASKTTGNHFCEAFNIESDKLKFLGLPRLDYLGQPDDKIVDEIRATYRLNVDKEIVLYIPTFRKDSSIDLTELIQVFDYEKSTLVVKLHPLDKLNLDFDCNAVIDGVIIDESYSSYQWLNACDKIITDYSALGIEAVVKNKPLYFYLYDINEYEKNVGLNIDLRNEFGKYAVENITDLKKVLQEDYDFDLLKKIRDKYITVPLDNCTSGIVKFIIQLMEVHK